MKKFLATLFLGLILSTGAYAGATYTVFVKHYFSYNVYKASEPAGVDLPIIKKKALDLCRSSEKNPEACLLQKLVITTSSAGSNIYKIYTDYWKNSSNIFKNFHKLNTYNKENKTNFETLLELETYLAKEEDKRRQIAIEKTHKKVLEEYNKEHKTNFKTYNDLRNHFAEKALKEKEKRLEKERKEKEKERNKLFLKIIVVSILMFTILSLITKRIRAKELKEYNKEHKTGFKTHNELQKHLDIEKENKLLKEEKRLEKERKKEEAKKQEEEKRLEKERLQEEQRLAKEEKAAASEPSSSDIGARLKKLRQMYKDGILSKVEFEKAKNKLLK